MSDHHKGQGGLRSVGVIALLAFTIAPARANDEPAVQANRTSRIQVVGAACRTKFATARSAQSSSVASLKALVRQVLKRQPPAAQAVEIQGAVLFALDQTQIDPLEVVAALTEFDLTDLSVQAAKAIKNLRTLRRRSICEVGTAGLAGEASLTMGPGASGGGLTSDYQAR